MPAKQREANVRQGPSVAVIDAPPIEVEPDSYNERYQKTKREKLNHVFEKYLAGRRICKGS